MKSSSIWMAALTFTAVILAAILLTGGQRPAEAAMINNQPGFTLMTSALGGGDEGVIVIDKAKQKMIVYTFKANELVIVAGR